MRKAIVMTLVLLCAVAQGAWAETVTDETTLRTAIGAIADNGSGSITLDGDINISKEIEIGDGKSVTIDLNGATLDRGLTAPKEYGHVLKILSGATLTIEDNSATQKGTIRGGWTWDGGNINNAGTLNLIGGTVTGGGCLQYGGGIWNQGTLNIKSNVRVTGNAGGDIYLPNGKVINVMGAITSGANSIGISMAQPGTFTNGYRLSGTTTNPFFSNNANDIKQVSDEFKMIRGYYNYIYTLNGTTATCQRSDIPSSAVDFSTLNPVDGGINLNDTWYVVTQSRTIDAHVWAKSTTNIILCDGVTLTLQGGLVVRNEDDATLNIFAQSFGETSGRLVVTQSWDFAAAIGGPSSTAVGTIAIHGGNVSATGAEDGAGIGGGKSSSGGTVIIYNGKVTAIGGKRAAGIGGSVNGSGGTFTIYGGEVIAQGGEDGAGIGSGEGFSENIGGGTVTINGGKVTAIGGNAGAGIGCGGRSLSYRSHGGTVTINGGNVTAIGGEYGAGIGGGHYGDGSTVTVNGGEVLATGNYGGAGIGSGFAADKNDNTRNGTFTMNGGTVNAKGGGNAAGIGGGYRANQLDDITINDGHLEAEGVLGGAGIGGGLFGSGGNVFIYKGEVMAKGWTGTQHDGYNNVDYNAAGVAIGGGGKVGDATINTGTITFGNLRVRQDASSYCRADERTAACRYTGAVYITACDAHDMFNFTSATSTGHTHSCGFCARQETETYGTDGAKCSKCGLLSLQDGGSNETVIGAEHSNKQPVVLAGRTLYKDGKWNTLCLPFSVNLASGPLSGDNPVAMVFDKTTSGFDGGTLTLNFSDAPATIPAGTPFLIKWDNTGVHLAETDLVFSEVTIDATTRDVSCDLGDGKAITFCGTYKATSFTGENRSVLFLGGNNTLYYPKPSGNTYPTIGAQRAYFELDGYTVSDPSSPDAVRAFVLSFADDPLTQEGYFGDDDTTGIKNVQWSMFNGQWPII